jgi:hypothetical protein
VCVGYGRNRYGITTERMHGPVSVIASASEAIQSFIFGSGLLRRVAPLRKRLAFAAGNDACNKKAALKAPLFENRLGGKSAYAASASFSCTGPESRPLASTSRSTNSITAIAALSP